MCFVLVFRELTSLVGGYFRENFKVGLFRYWQDQPRRVANIEDASFTSRTHEFCPIDRSRMKYLYRCVGNDSPAT